MQTFTTKFLLFIAEVLIWTIVLLMIPIIAGIDAIITNEGINEISITEAIQELLILLSAISCGIAAYKYQNSRGLMTLLAGLFGCMLIRELDNFLDHIAHGFWLYPALTLAFVSILIALTCRETIIPTLMSYFNTKPFTYLIIGMLLTVIFSRTFGSSILWEPVMGINYQATFKSVIQEGLELLGYLHISYGTLLLIMHEKKLNATDKIK